MAGCESAAGGWGLADYFGVSYRHLLHTLKWLREVGYIEKQRWGTALRRRRCNH